MPKFLLRRKTEWWLILSGNLTCFIGVMCSSLLLLPNVHLSFSKSEVDIVFFCFLSWRIHTSNLIWEWNHKKDILAKRAKILFQLGCINKTCLDRLLQAVTQVSNFRSYLTLRILILAHKQVWVIIFFFVF